MFTFISRKTRAALKCFFFAKEIKRILIHSNENETFDSFIGGVHASRVAAEVAIVESAYPCRCTQCRNGADCFRFCWTKTSPSLYLSLSLSLQSVGDGRCLLYHFTVVTDQLNNMTFITLLSNRYLTHHGWFLVILLKGPKVRAVYNRFFLSKGCWKLCGRSSCHPQLRGLVHR